MAYLKEDVYKACFDYFKGNEMAVESCMNKYLLRDLKGNFLEKNPIEMLERIAKEYYRIEQKYNNPLSYDEIWEALNDFKYVVPQGSPLFGIGNNEQIISVANCFVIGAPVDSYGGILQKDEELVQLMKRRGGVGIDLSSLRPRGMNVKNGARTSDGISCFMERFSNSTKEVAQNGRRGALMISILCSHMDIEHFISIKENLSKVTGANISVKWTDEFLKQVENDGDFVLRHPAEASVKDAIATRTVKARDIWDKFVKANWKSAEPGCIFWDNMINYSISDWYDDFKTISTNPCVAGDTLVSTDKGDVTIQDIINDDFRNYKIYSYNEDTNKIELDEIINGALTRKNANVIELELEDGEKITLTPDHKVYTQNRGYIKASQLTEEDELVLIE